MIQYNPNLKMYYSTKINDDRFLSGFGTRYTGDARDVIKIFDFFGNNKIQVKKLIILGQIHSTNVFYFTPEDEINLPGIGDWNLNSDLTPIKIDDTDGIVTGASNVVLTVRTGDCIPMIFADKTAHLIGISHQGWRGSLKKLPIKVIEMMIEKGSKKEDIIVSIGPAIGPCCYNIDDDRYYSFLEEFNGYANKIFTLRGEKRYLNLMLLNYLFLKDFGIKEDNIDYFPFCTFCNEEKFFSHRRDFKKNKYGEMLSFIEIQS